MQRHHKANDFYFACLFPVRFGLRYMEFHCDDVAILCTLCHNRIHRLYKPIMEEFFVARKAGLSIELCEDYKQKCLNAFNKWVKK